MNKRVAYLALLSVLIVGIAINTSHQLILWGFETVSGGDEFMHFARAQNIARGYVDVYHEYDNPSYYDFYPGGFHVLSAEFIILSGFQPHYYTSLIFKAIFTLSVIIYTFLIGSKINWKVGIFSSFFFITYFQIYTWSKTFYISVASPQNSLSSNFISTPIIFFTILIYLLFLKAKENEFKYGMMIAFLGTVHGISHISTYIGFILNFLGFSLLILIISYIKYRSYVPKIVKIVLYTLITIPMVFFIYYYPMFPEILSSRYYPEKFFPSFIPLTLIPYLPIISVFMIIGLSSSLFLYGRYVRSHEITYVRTHRRFFALLIFLYISMYAIVLFLISRNPYVYPGSGDLILMGVFPTYVPRGYPGIVSTLSLFVGLSMYLLTLLTFIWAYRSKFINFNFILIMYFSFYSVWFASAVLIKYYPSRIMYFQYVLPFLYSAGLVSLISRGKTDTHKKRFFSIFTKPLIKKLVAISIVGMFLAMNVVSQITKEPELRPQLDIDRIALGKTRPPREVSSFLYELDYLTDPGDYILATPETLEVASTTEGLRSPTNHWSQTYADHTSWAITVNAIRGNNMADFFDRYDADYLVVGYGDIHGFAEVFGNKYHDPDMYSKNPNLILIYEDQYGERVYRWVG